MNKLAETPTRRRIQLRSLRPRRRHLQSARRLKPSRRHVRYALMATTPTAALFGFGGMHAASAPAATTILRQAPDISPLAAAEAVARAEPAPAAVEASYYGDGFAGKLTANGEIFDPAQMTAAHRTLPFGTIVLVTDAATGQSVEVRINDRGPFHGNREIDLSEGAAREIGMIGAGTAKVILEQVRNA